MSVNRYNFSLTTFNPAGELKQVEYANNCGSKGAPTVGIITKNGLVLATEKRIDSKLTIGRTVKKLEKIGSHMAMAYSGMAPDFRILSKMAQKTCAAYSLVHSGIVPVDGMAMAVSNTMQEFTQSCGVRPFGLSVLLGGWERGHARLYRLDAAGSLLPFRACAVGKDAEQRMEILERHYNPKLTMEFAIYLAIQTIRMGDEQSMPAQHFEIGIIDKTGFRRLDIATIEAYLTKMN
ncbi:proteasome subunit alpha type-2-like [Drosophila montana]|uniref:proteasome subunit alpha type-2-like n=1 Tax=Drosophila montana TaxID=40370 RepID=UPI00313F1596